MPDHDEWANARRHFASLSKPGGFISTGNSEQLDIPQTAAAYIREYGSDAALIAWGIADSHACNGEEKAYKTWIRVMVAIEEISAKIPAPLPVRPVRPTDEN